MKYICADNVPLIIQYLPQRCRSEMIGYPLMQLGAGALDGSVPRPKYVGGHNICDLMNFRSASFRVSRSHTCKQQHSLMRYLVPEFAGTVSILFKTDPSRLCLIPSHTLRSRSRPPLQHNCHRHNSILSWRNPSHYLAMGTNRLTG